MSKAHRSPPMAQRANAELGPIPHLPYFHKEGDALEFWTQGKPRFHNSAVVASSFLGAGGSLAASERDFPMAGSVITKNRSRLLPQVLEMHCLVWDCADLMSKALNDVSVLCGEQAAKMRKMTPLSGRPQVDDDEDSLSSDENAGKHCTCCTLTQTLKEARVRRTTLKSTLAANF